MMVFESMQSKNIDELAKWFDKYCMSDGSPWYAWYDRKYCKNCEPVIVEDAVLDKEYGWCELNNHKCKFFQDMECAPYGKHLIKLWLESEDDYGI